MANLQSTSVTGSLTLGNTPNTSATGYIWFDNTANQLKYTVDTVGTSDTFSAGGTHPSCVTLNMIGNSKSAVSFGQTGTNIHKYDGTSWSADAVGPFNQCAFAAGTANSAVFNNGLCGDTFYYDGFGMTYYGPSLTPACSKIAGGSNSWMTVCNNSCFASRCYYLNEVGQLVCTLTSYTQNTVRCRFAMSGTAGDAVNKMGGFCSPTFFSDLEEFNGTSWSAGPNMINTRGDFVATGTQNSTWAIGGNPTVNVDCTTEKYNGTSWSAGPAITCFQSQLVTNPGSGTQGSALFTYSNALSAAGTTCEVNAPYTGTIVTCTC